MTLTLFCLFICLFNCTHSIWKFLGRRLSPGCGCNLRHGCSNSGSLTHCARPGVKPVLLQRQHWILNPLCHCRNSWASFNMLICHLCIFYGEVPIHIFCPLFNLFIWKQIEGLIFKEECKVQNKIERKVQRFPCAPCRHTCAPFPSNCVAPQNAAFLSFFFF